MQEKVVMVEIADHRQCIVNVGATPQTATLPKTLDGVGPHLAAMRVYMFGQDFGAGFTVTLQGEHSYDGTTWTAFTTNIMSNNQIGNYIGSLYTATQDFGPMIRFLLVTQATNAGTGGTVSISVALIFQS